MITFPSGVAEGEVEEAEEEEEEEEVRPATIKLIRFPSSL